MKTKILQANQINEAVALLKYGEIVALPTETVYGLAADAANDEAVNKIFIAKGRPKDHPLIIHLDSFDKARDWAEVIPENAEKLATQFWPGPLTMVLKKRKELAKLISSREDTIALRIPDHDIVREVIKKLGTAIAAPSANTHKRTSPTEAAHVLKTLSGKIAAIIDAGQCHVGLESTIIDMSKEIPQILRPGPITASMIEKVLDTKIECSFNHIYKMPGNMKIHYQTVKPIYLMSFSEIENKTIYESRSAIMHFSDITKKKNVTYYKMSRDKDRYARDLYKMLHLIDSSDADKIIVEKPPALDLWADINDRLEKASTRE